MNSEEYLSCPNTPQLKLCTKPMALVSALDQLCLTALLDDPEVAALKACVREVTELPILSTAVYLGNSIYLLCAAGDQQFLYNITYQDGKKLSSRVNGCKSCLVHHPCSGKLLHPTNGLVMLHDPAQCVEQSGSITTISNPDNLDAVSAIPSLPTNLSINKQQTLTLHRVRSELQYVPTLEVTHQLIKKLAGKIQTQCKKDSSKEHLFQPSWRKTLSELAGLLAFTLWMLRLLLAAVWIARKFYVNNRKRRPMNSSSIDPFRNAGNGTPTKESLNLVERMRIEDTQVD